MPSAPPKVCFCPVCDVPCPWFTRVRDVLRREHRDKGRCVDKPATEYTFGGYVCATHGEFGQPDA